MSVTQLIDGTVLSAVCRWSWLGTRQTWRQTGF